MAGLLGLSSFDIYPVVGAGKAYAAAEVGKSIGLIFGYAGSDASVNFLGMYHYIPGSKPIITKIAGTSNAPTSNAAGTISFEGNSVPCTRWWIITF